MSSNHSRLCRDLVGGSLQIKSQTVLDQDANLRVNSARVASDMKVKGDLTVSGNLITQNQGNVDELLAKIEVQEAQITALMGRAETTFADLPIPLTLDGTDFALDLQLTSTDTPSFMTWGPESVSQTGNIFMSGTYCVGFAYAAAPSVGPTPNIVGISASITIQPAVGAPIEAFYENAYAAENLGTAGTLVAKAVLDETQVPALLQFRVAKNPTPSDDLLFAGANYAWVTKLR